MTPNAVSERPTARPHDPATSVAQTWLILLVSGALALGAVAALDRRPARIGALTIQNPTAYEVDIEVAGASGDWLPVGSARPHSELRLSDVIDQGDTWQVRYSARGRRAPVTQIARRDLQANGWKIDVPPNVVA
jgi:hypothetical protein